MLRRALGLTRRSGFEDAVAAGERFAAEFDMGNVPAMHPADVMERDVASGRRAWHGKKAG